MRTTKLLAALVVSVLVAAPVSHAAQPVFPDKPIRLITNFVSPSASASPNS